MIIQCDKCATKFRLDDSRVTPNGVKVRCTKCDNVFIVTPPPAPEEAQVEELFSGMMNDEQTPVPAAAGFQARTQTPKPKENDNRHLAFDFDSSVTREDIFKTAERPADDFGAGEGLSSSNNADAGKKFSLDDLDFSFSSDPAEEEKKEDAGWETDQGLTNNSPDLSESADKGYQVDLGSDEPSKEEKTDLDFGFDDLSGAEKSASWSEEEKEEPIEEPEPQKPVMAENVIPFQAAAYNKEGKAPAEAKTAIDEDEKEKAFKAVLSKTIDRDREEAFSFGKPVEDIDDEDIPEEEDDAPQRSQSKMGLIVAALVIVLGGGLIYFTGVIDRLTSLIMPPASSELKVVEIESIKGFYEENKNFGKVFVIDARVKNITDEPQEIKAATGIIYNDDGDKITEKSVSPGRLVSMDDVRNLQKEELERAFRDPSGGMIPARGSVPVMVLFTDIPQGLSEFGLDVVR